MGTGCCESKLCDNQGVLVTTPCWREKPLLAAVDHGWGVSAHVTNCKLKIQHGAVRTWLILQLEREPTPTHHSRANCLLAFAHAVASVQNTLPVSSTCS